MLPLDETPFGVFVPPLFGIKLASEAWERRAHFALRRATFCYEQGLFASDDRDEADARAIAIVAVSFVMGSAHEVLGTVRVHAGRDGRWYGSRLAIDPAYRGLHGLGSALVLRAVATARARGCAEFHANVQRQNVTFFERLGWQEIGQSIVCGRAHAVMAAPLAAMAEAVDDAAIAMLRSRIAS